MGAESLRRMRPATWCGLACLVGITVLLGPSAGRAATIQSAFTASPPTVDGTAGATEWAGAATFTLAHGTVFIENDSSNLYLLFDMGLDTTSDAGDSYFAEFDVNRNGVGDPNVDVLYFPCVGALVARSFLGNAASCSWNSCVATSAVAARGFGATPTYATPHVFFEVSIPLSEMGAHAQDLLRVNLGYASVNPSFADNLGPSFECNFAGYTDLLLGPSPIPAVGRLGLALLAALLVGIGLWAVRHSLAG